MPAHSSFVFDTFSRMDLNFERGEGAWLYTEKGDTYLDFTSGIAVNAFGYGHPYLVKALTEQAQKLWHISNLFRIEGQEKLAERLCAHSFAEKVFFVNSGAEAVETAIKTVRRYYSQQGQKHKNEIITFEGAFHGRTLGTIAAAGQEKYLEGFDPICPGFKNIPFADINALKAAITPQTAAILIEPIQAEGGVHAADKTFMKNLRDLCDTYELLLIFDEVQTGMGRSGKLFAYEWNEITPDILCLAKAIGAGFPLGACLTKEKIAKAMGLGTHGSTFGGNPLAMAVGNAALDLFLEPHFLKHVQNIAQIFHRELKKLIACYGDIIEDFSGQGLLIGLKCVLPNTRLLKACTEEKLLLVLAGKNMVRLLPPLILSEEEAHIGLTRLEKALKNLQSTKYS